MQIWCALAPKENMGLDVDVRLRFVVKKADGEICDDGERLFAFLGELAAGGIRVLEPMRVVRLARLGQLQCTADSRLRTKTGAAKRLNGAQAGGNGQSRCARNMKRENRRGKRVAREVLTHCHFSVQANCSR